MFFIFFIIDCELITSSGIAFSSCCLIFSSDKLMGIKCAIIPALRIPRYDMTKSMELSRKMLTIEPFFR